MSWHRPVWLYCDPGEESGSDCEASGDGSLNGSTTVAEARRWAATFQGWHVTRGPDGKVRDVCPDCWDAGLR